MKVLVLNAGSSSLKYQLFDMPSGDVVAKGGFESIGSQWSFVVHKVGDGKEKIDVVISNHAEALTLLLEYLLKGVGALPAVLDNLEDLHAVWHRVVHGGEFYSKSVLIDDEVIANIDALSALAPLHNPAHLQGILGIKQLLPNCPQVAVFDTAFHQTMSPEAFIYPIPYELYEKHSIRRYGFHGTSHKYLWQQISQYPEFAGKKDLKVITCHLGNGASLTAIKDGKVIDTSMGFTPLDGLMMGTRSGTIDPAIVLYIQKHLGMSVQEVEDMLNKKSGLLGISGVSNDMREIWSEHEQNNQRAILAIDIYVRSIVKFIGAYIPLLGGLDALIFAGGVGERGIAERKLIVQHLDWLGVTLDEGNNQLFAQEVQISTPESRVKVLVIPTDEELMIAKDTYELSK